MSRHSFLTYVTRRVKVPPRTRGEPTMITLDGKTIAITGASRGIGEAIARACLEHGARVVLASRKQVDLDKVAAELPADRVLAVAAHTGKADEVDAMIARAVEKFGRVDGLVNNAA